MVKLVTEIEGYTHDQVWEAFVNFEMRKKWDKVLEKFSIIEKNNDENSEIVYFVIKVSFLINK
jgi:hypothetical protein